MDDRVFHTIVISPDHRPDLFMPNKYIKREVVEWVEGRLGMDLWIRATHRASGPGWRYGVSLVLSQWRHPNHPHDLLHIFDFEDPQIAIIFKLMWG
jgi:hypothetical protein